MLIQSLRIATRSPTLRRGNSISALQAAFRDPSSPFHIPPGTQGPEGPDAPPQLSSSSASLAESSSDALEEGRQKLLDAGFDPKSFWEQRIVWGDHDSMQHVNNVRYVRFFESGRVKWMMSIGDELGGSARASAMSKGQGISFILKSIAVRFRRPVTFPDTLLIGYRPYLPPSHNDPAIFHLAASAYSITQRTFVAHADEVMAWYDYDNLKKCDPGEELRTVLYGRIRQDIEFDTSITIR